jgi:transcriptional regulator with XRE-family HTH domain
MENFRQRLKYARKKAGLTQSQLSKIVGVTQTTVSEIESGRKGSKKSNVFLFYKLSKALGVTMEWLLMGDE